MLQERVGYVFLVFSLLSLIYNLFFPNNPDYCVSVVVESVVSAVFFVSIFLEHIIVKCAQVVCILTGASLAVMLSPEPFFGAVMLIFALVLTYAYGGYKSMSIDRVSLVVIAVYVFMVIASAKVAVPPVETYFKAGGWTAFVCIFCAVLWFVIDDIDKKSHKEHDLALLKANKRVVMDSVKSIKDTKMTIDEEIEARR